MNNESTNENTTEVVEENKTVSNEVTLETLKTQLDSLQVVASSVLASVQSIMTTMSDFVEAGATVAEKTDEAEDAEDIDDAVDDYVEDLEDLDFTVTED